MIDRCDVTVYFGTTSRADWFHRSDNRNSVRNSVFVDCCETPSDNIYSLFYSSEDGVYIGQVLIFSSAYGGMSFI